MTGSHRDSLHNCLQSYLQHRIQIERKRPEIMKTFIKILLISILSLLFASTIQAQQSGLSLVLTDEQEIYSVAEYAEI